MKPPSTALLMAFSPLWRTGASAARPWVSEGCLAAQRQRAVAFSTTDVRQKRDRGQKTDTRISAIRYHLSHALTPRPLRISRLRALRHWTIHRAWQLYQSKQRKARELELERQYNSMAAACEALRLMDERGMTRADAERIGATPPEESNIGRLYRTAMHNAGVWDHLPMEYARLQTESPPRDGWNESWTR